MARSTTKKAAVKKGIRAAKETVVKQSQQAVKSVKKAGRSADAYAHNKPWHVAMVAASAGFLAGLLIRPKKK